MSKKTHGVRELTLRADKISKNISSLSTKNNSATKVGSKSSVSSSARPSYRGASLSTTDKAYSL